MKWLKNQKGDTVVEVLLSVAVLSLILSISYGLANRSTMAVRASQERSEALKVNEAQQESLKTYLSDPNHEVPAEDVPFCLSAGAIQTPPACSEGTDSRYSTQIILDNGVYTATTTWDRISGGQDRLQIAYKVYLASDTEIDLTEEPDDGSQSCPDDYELTELGCAPIPPNIRVTVKKVRALDNNRVTPTCTDTKENKQGISVTLDGVTQQTGTDSTTLFTRKDFNRNHTATLTVPAGYQACNGLTSSVTTTSQPRAVFDTSPELSIRPICTGSITQQPVYGWVNVLVDWNSGWSVGGYIKSYRYSTGGYPLGYGPTFISYMPAGPEGLGGYTNIFRWANGNPAANPAGNLYDFYFGNYWQTPIYQQQWLQTGTTPVDTRACPA